jgi:hypothetical protein
VEFVNRSDPWMKGAVSKICFALPVSVPVFPGSQIGLARVVVHVAVMILLVSTTTAGEAARPNFILMSQSGGLVGGKTEKTQVLLIEHSGDAQAWVETSDDQLLYLKTGRTDPRALFESASQIFNCAAEAAPSNAAPGPDLLPEYFPPRLLVRVRLDGQEKSWLGGKESVPTAWRDLAAQLLAFHESGKPLEPAPPGRYLRCEELTGDVVRFMREAGLIQDLGPAELSARPLVRDVISRQPTVLAVPGQTDPLDGLRKPKGDSTRTHLAVQGHCYLIRVLTYNPIAGQAPGKETPK